MARNVRNNHSNAGPNDIALISPSKDVQARYNPCRGAYTQDHGRAYLEYCFLLSKIVVYLYIYIYVL